MVHSSQSIHTTLNLNFKLKHHRNGNFEACCQQALLTVQNTTLLLTFTVQKYVYTLVLISSDWEFWNDIIRMDLYLKAGKKCLVSKCLTTEFKHTVRSEKGTHLPVSAIDLFNSNTLLWYFQSFSFPCSYSLKLMPSLYSRQYTRLTTPQWLLPFMCSGQWEKVLLYEVQDVMWRQPCTFFSFFTLLVASAVCFFCVLSHSHCVGLHNCIFAFLVMGYVL